MSLCELCDAPATGQCDRCNLAHYCSAPCLREDWLDHKEDCLDTRNPLVLARVLNEMNTGEHDVLIGSLIHVGGPADVEGGRKVLEDIGRRLRRKKKKKKNLKR